jgi:ribosomal protein S19
MARSSWKFTYLSSNIYKNIFKSKFKQIKQLNIFSRKSSIPKTFVKKAVQIYKGNIFNKIILSKYNTSYKFGEFSFTRKPFNFPQKKSKR